MFSTTSEAWYANVKERKRKSKLKGEPCAVVCQGCERSVMVIIASPFKHVLFFRFLVLCVLFALFRPPPSPSRLHHPYSHAHSVVRPQLILLPLHNLLAPGHFSDHFNTVLGLHLQSSASSDSIHSHSRTQQSSPALASASVRQKL